MFGTNCGANLQKPKELFEIHIRGAKEQKFPLFFQISEAILPCFGLVLCHLLVVKPNYVKFLP